MQTWTAKRLIVLLTAPALWAAWSCSGDVSDPTPFTPGMLAIRLQPAAAIQFQTVNYQLTRPNGFFRSGPVAVAQAEAHESFGFKVDELDPADDYELTVMSAAKLVDKSTETTCRGRTSFTIASARSTSVALRVQCDGVSTTGSTQNNGVNQCPAVLALRAAPDSAAVGGDVMLHADIRDAQDGPKPLSYSWTSVTGPVSGSSNETKFHCAKPGSVALSLTVSDGDDMCSDTQSIVYVTCTDAACLASGTCAPLHNTQSAGSGAPANVSVMSAGAGALAANGSGGVGSPSSAAATAGAGAAPAVVEPSAGSAAVSGGLVGDILAALSAGAEAAAPANDGEAGAAAPLAGAPAVNDQGAAGAADDPASEPSAGAGAESPEPGGDRNRNGGGGWRRNHEAGAAAPQPEAGAGSDAPPVSNDPPVTASDVDAGI